MSSPKRSRRYTELVNSPEDGKPPLIVEGGWVVVRDPACERPLVLAVVTGGPSYTHVDGHALDAVWELSDGSARSVMDLTPIDLAELLREATGILSAIRSGRDPSQYAAQVLRTSRAACLAARAAATAPREHADLLTALVELDRSIAEHEAAWREMVRTRLPNLARSLWGAAACELARCPDWTPGVGVVHPSLKETN